MHAPASPTLPATVPVSFELSPARNGWIGLTVRAGDQSDEISCSDAFDPFQEIVDLMLRLSHGLNGCVEIDDKGFVLTGGAALPLETSKPGVFAIGDVRSGSVKRVAAGVGEGAAVVAQIHQALAAQHEEAAA